MNANGRRCSPPNPRSSRASWSARLTSQVDSHREKDTQAPRTARHSAPLPAPFWQCFAFARHATKQGRWMQWSMQWGVRMYAGVCLCVKTVEARWQAHRTIHRSHRVRQVSRMRQCSAAVSSDSVHWQRSTGSRSLHVSCMRPVLSCCRAQGGARTPRGRPLSPAVAAAPVDWRGSAVAALVRTAGGHLTRDR